MKKQRDKQGKFTPVDHKELYKQIDKGLSEGKRPSRIAIEVKSDYQFLYLYKLVLKRKNRKELTEKLTRGTPKA